MSDDTYIAASHYKHVAKPGRRVSFIEAVKQRGDGWATYLYGTKFDGHGDEFTEDYHDYILMSCMERGSIPRIGR